MAQLRAALGLVLLFTVLLGGVYPLAVSVIAQGAFNHAANGSLVEKDGHVVGSELLGQQFDSPNYFWGRPSATTPPYNAAASAGSNLNPANPMLLDLVNARIAALQKADPGNKAPIPAGLVTASASGVDPDISISAAMYQASRVAKARHMKQGDVEELVKEVMQRRELGALGEPRVNVLQLNLLLDNRK